MVHLALYTQLLSFGAPDLSQIYGGVKEIGVSNGPKVERTRKEEKRDRKRLLI